MGFVLVWIALQRGDRMRSYDDRLDLFTNLNEPFYKSYVRQNLGQIMVEEVGTYRGLNSANGWARKTPADGLG